MKSKEPIHQLLKRYQIKLNRSLSLRRMVDMCNPKTKKYAETYNEMLNAEIECQELDEKIFWRIRTMNFETEYINHLKQNQK